MDLQERIDMLVSLGHYLETNDEKTEAAYELAYLKNRWFTKENIAKALTSIRINFLDKEKLNAWCASYNMQQPVAIKNVGLILAGNIPAVGFHDLLCTFLVGHKSLIKTSEKDTILITYLVQQLIILDARCTDYFEFVERVAGYDAVIATGTNNSANHFKAYFGKHPHIIRKNRNAVAVFFGEETKIEMNKLAADIFDYFGLGCRSISKLYLPKGYDILPFMEVTHEFRQIVNHSKYKNNFDYNFAIFVMNKDKYFSNGCILVKQDTRIASRIASLHYEYYDSLEELSELLTKNEDQIQCVEAQQQIPGVKTIPFGSAQSPSLSTYADDVDTIQFLLSL